MNFGSVGRGQASWVVQILPQLEEADLKSNLASLSVGVTPAIGKIPVLFCPSANRKDNRGLNFQVNAGAVDDFTSGDPWTYDTNSSNGVFLDSAVIKDKGKSSIVRLDDISKYDGTSATLLIAENVNAGFWIAEEGTHLCCERDGTSTPPSPLDNLTSGTDKIEGSVGFCWAREYVGTPYVGSDEAEAASRPKQFLQFSSDCSSPLSGERIPRMFNQCVSTTFGEDWYHSARPSSNHPSVVMVSFCDGHVKALRDNISAKVFVQLMTGRDKESDAKNLIGNDLLDKADYE
jgi:prepilin-type processing-associated H-X9-DG protein